MTKLLLKSILWSLLAAVTLEVCARFDDWITYGAPLLENYDNGTLNAFDAIGNRGKPHARYLKWQLNSLGFRNPELDPSRPKLLCIGSSETFGQFEPDGFEWPRQLERQLTGVQVVNAGFAGETFPTSVKRLPEHLAQVKPVVVVLYPSVAHYLSIPFMAHYHGPPPPPAPRPRMQARFETAIKQILPEALTTRLKQRQIEREAPAYGPLLDDMPPELVQRFEEDLRAAVHLIRQNGAAPVLVTHANRFGKSVLPAERPMLISWRKFYPNLREDGFVRMEQTMNQVTIRLALEEKVTLVDAARDMPTGPRYFADYVHFTSEGAALFSKFIAQALAHCNWTQSPPCPRLPL